LFGPASLFSAPSNSLFVYLALSIEDDATQVLKDRLAAKNMTTLEALTD